MKIIILIGNLIFSLLKKKKINPKQTQVINKYSFNPRNLSIGSNNVERMKIKKMALKILLKVALK